MIPRKEIDLKTTVTLPELEQHLAEREAGYQDLTVPAAEIRMEPERGHLVIHGEPHPLQDHVLTLFAPKLGNLACFARSSPFSFGPPTETQNLVLFGG